MRTKKNSFLPRLMLILSMAVFTATAMGPGGCGGSSSDDEGNNNGADTRWEQSLERERRDADARQQAEHDAADAQRARWSTP